jgi:hypothetical protein
MMDFQFDRPGFDSALGCLRRRRIYDARRDAVWAAARRDDVRPHRAAYVHLLADSRSMEVKGLAKAIPLGASKGADSWRYRMWR